MIALSLGRPDIDFTHKEYSAKTDKDLVHQLLRIEDSCAKISNVGDQEAIAYPIHDELAPILYDLAEALLPWDMTLWSTLRTLAHGICHNLTPGTPKVWDPLYFRFQPQNRVLPPLWHFIPLERMMMEYQYMSPSTVTAFLAGRIPFVSPNILGSPVSLTYFDEGKRSRSPVKTPAPPPAALGDISTPHDKRSRAEPRAQPVRSEPSVTLTAEQFSQLLATVRPPAPVFPSATASADAITPSAPPRQGARSSASKEAGDPRSPIPRQHRHGDAPRTISAAKADTGDKAPGGGYLRTYLKCTPPEIPAHWRVRHVYLDRGRNKYFESWITFDSRRPHGPTVTFGCEQDWPYPQGDTSVPHDMHAHEIICITAGHAVHRHHPLPFSHLAQLRR